MPREHPTDRLVSEPQWTIRIITLVILIAGGAAVVYAFLRTDARRERAVSGLEVGDTTAAVVERLGRPPHVCETGTLAHLEDQFPGGWPGAARNRATGQLRQETAERWLYPLAEATVDPCVSAAESTEIGIGHDHRVIWFVPLTGRQPLRLPDWLAPGPVTNETIPEDA